MVFVISSSDTNSGLNFTYANESFRVALTESTPESWAMPLSLEASHMAQGIPLT